jgi:hypothetical protein
MMSKKEEALMLNCNICCGVRKLSDCVKDTMSGRMAAFNNICAFFTFYLLEQLSVSSLARTCPWTFSVSDLSRAIDGFDSNRFMRRHRSSVLRRYKGGEMLNSTDFCYAVDDTDNPKYGKGVYGVGKWKGSKGHYIGQKILVVVMVDIIRGYAIPLHYAFVGKKGEPGYLSGIELGVKLFEDIIHANFPLLPVAADSWFDSVDFMKGLRKIGLHYCGEIKGNRRVKDNPGPNVAWVKLPQLFSGKTRKRLHTRLDSEKVRKRKKKGKCGATLRIMIRDYGSMLSAIAVYNTRRSKEAFAYYVSTDLTIAGARLWEISRARWKIECMFRDLKQNLSFGRLPCQGKEAADLAVCMPFVLYTSLRLESPEYWGLKQKCSVSGMLRQIRERELCKSIDLLACNPNHPKVLRLKARRQRLSCKPVNRAAGKIRGPEKAAA